MNVAAAFSERGRNERNVFINMHIYKWLGCALAEMCAFRRQNVLVAIAAMEILSCFN